MTGQRDAIRALFVVEYGMGHKTHTRFLEPHLAADPRFQATVVRLPDLLDFLPRLPLPPLQVGGFDFGVWWQLQVRRLQLHRWLQWHRVDPGKLDLLYIHTQTAAGAILDLPRRVPVVVSIDLTWQLAFREGATLASPLFAPLHRLERRLFERAGLDFERRIFERSDLIVSFSEWAATSVIEDYGIPAEKVAVVRNGITLPNGDGNGATNGNHAANGHHGANGANGMHEETSDLAPLRLGFVGNQFFRKGGDLLLRVHQAHFAEEAHLTIIVSSDPPQSAGLRNVSLHSNVPWEELMTSLLPGFDLFVFPTRADYSPYAVIEAMAAGVPVVATRVGAIPEMIEDGVDGFLLDSPCEAPLADRVDWAISNRGHLAEMGARARQRAADSYAAERTYPQLLDLLAAVGR